MGTKNNPGTFDCYANAEPDEPMFVLLGRDPTASLVVTLWRSIKMQMREDGTSSIGVAKLDEARDVSVDLEDWARAHGKDPRDALKAFETVLRRMSKEAQRT